MLGEASSGPAPVDDQTFDDVGGREGVEHVGGGRGGPRCGEPSLGDEDAAPRDELPVGDVPVILEPRVGGVVDGDEGHARMLPEEPPPRLAPSSGPYQLIE